MVRDLSEQYAAAMREWADDDAEAWESVVGDGIETDPQTA